LHHEGERVQRPETVEAHGDAVEIEKRIGRDRHRRVHSPASCPAGCATIGAGGALAARAAMIRSQSPTMPLGRNSVTRMKSPPSAKSQSSGGGPVKMVLRRLPSPAPMMAPTRVPRPPTATQITASIELAGANSPGLM